MNVQVGQKSWTLHNEEITMIYKLHMCMHIWLILYWPLRNESANKSFKDCGISAEIDSSEDGLFNSRLFEVDTASGYCKTTLRRELDDLIFGDSNSESFDGFSN